MTVGEKVIGIGAGILAIKLEKEGATVEIYPLHQHYSVSIWDRNIIVKNLEFNTYVRFDKAHFDKNGIWGDPEAMIQTAGAAAAETMISMIEDTNGGRGGYSYASTDYWNEYFRIRKIKDDRLIMQVIRKSPLHNDSIVEFSGIPDIQIGKYSHTDMRVFILADQLDEYLKPSDQAATL